MNIKTLNNVGEQRAKVFNSLGIYTIEDLIEYFPRDYEDRSVIQNIKDCEVGDVVNIKGKVDSKGQNAVIRSLTITKVKVRDKTGIIDIVWYNQPYLKNSFNNNGEYIFSGKVTEKYKKKQLESPDYEAFSEELLSSGRIVPVYKLKEKLSQKMIRKYINDALGVMQNNFFDILPESIRDAYRLCDIKYAINNIHFPESSDAFFSARRRIVFEELLILQLTLFTMKGVFTRGKNEPIKNINIDEITDALQFKLTNAQEAVMNEIKKDFTSCNVMYRLIQGDVGSGKTAVAMLACFTMIRNGYQAIIMAPTEVLAVQHYENFKMLFDKFGINTVLLTGSLRKKEKELVREEIANGYANMIVGTHAVIEDNINIKNLGLAITDEQHRFGVKQRSKLVEKGKNPNVLVMSATPIPRTLALILYGDLDISIINELPAGRQKIDTVFVNSSYKERIFIFMKKEVDSGRQAYIICPTVEESENSDLKSVVSYTEELKKEHFKDYPLEYLHGKMKPKEKQRIMEEFKEGKIKIIVSTTVIEVGINVPNATIMLIENADRFGLSQLHQLRGRVGRGSYKSYCILVSDAKSKTTKERMKVMTSTNDGFEISELDLKIRGAGDFFGTRQHGITEMKVANLYTDMDILKEAQKLSKQLFENSDYTNNIEFQALRTTVERYLNEKIHL